MLGRGTHKAKSDRATVACGGEVSAAWTCVPDATKFKALRAFGSARQRHEFWVDRTLPPGSQASGLSPSISASASIPLFLRSAFRRHLARSSIEAQPFFDARFSDPGVPAQRSHQEPVPSSTLVSAPRCSRSASDLQGAGCDSRHPLGNGFEAVQGCAHHSCWSTRRRHVFLLWEFESLSLTAKTGKGTQAERLLKRFPQLHAISSGDLLRENVRNKTVLGMLVRTR